MSTRAVVARETTPGHFQGRFHHFDGYPSGLGRNMWCRYQGVRREPGLSWEELQTILLDEKVDLWGPSLAEQPRPLTDRTAAQHGCEYGYVLIRNTAGEPVLRVLAIASIWTCDAAGAWYQRRSGPDFDVVAEVALDGPEPNWEVLDEQASIARERLSAWKPGDHKIDT